MDSNFDLILTHAMSLSTAERAILATRIIESLDSQEWSEPDGSLDETAIRLDEVRSNKVTLITSESATERIRARLQ